MDGSSVHGDRWMAKLMYWVNGSYGWMESDQIDQQIDGWNDWLDGPNRDRLV